MKSRSDPTTDRSHLMRKKINYDEAEFRRMWDAGVSAAEIASHFGASRQDWAYSKASLLGLPNRRQLNAEANDATIRKLWSTGLSLREIAEEIGKSREAVKWRAHVLELPSRREARRYDHAKPERDEKPKPREPVMRALPPHPKWPLRLDLKVFETRGKHEAIAKLAEEINRPIVAVQARWHLVGGRA